MRGGSASEEDIIECSRLLHFSLIQGYIGISRYPTRSRGQSWALRILRCSTSKIMWRVSQLERIDAGDRTRKPQNRFYQQVEVYWTVSQNQRLAYYRGLVFR